MIGRRLLPNLHFRILNYPVVLSALLMIGLLPSPASAIHPIVDGNITDLIVFANNELGTGGCGFVSDDPSKDVQTLDPTLIPCPPVVANYFQNGFDLVLTAAYYDPASQTLYCGIRTAGKIGDTDGNDNPNTFGGGGCNPLDNIQDGLGIGLGEIYEWNFDLSGDLVPDANIKVTQNALTSTGMPGSPTAFFAFSGTDLELSLGPVAMPASFAVQSSAGSNVDGLLADFDGSFRTLQGCTAPTDARASTWGAIKHYYR